MTAFGRIFWILTLSLSLETASWAATTGDLSGLSDAEQSEKLLDASDPRAQIGTFIGSRGINPGWKNRWVAERSPNMFGQTGLVRINSARAGKNGYFDIGIHARTFFADDFILQGVDSNTYADQSITFGFTLWDALEIGFATRAASNENALLTPRVTFAVGDFATSIKYAFDLDPVILAADVRGFLPAGSDRVGIAFDQMSLTGTFLATLDMYQSLNFPLRIHGNVGYAFQNSNRTLTLGDVHIDNASHFVTLTTNQWFYDQVVYGVGVESPLPYATPFVEFFARTPLNVEREFSFADDSMLILTPGLRFSIGRGLHIDTGVDFGLGGTGAIQGQPINPQWAAQVALAYTFSPFVAETQVEIREKEWSMGTITGCVVDSETELAVQEAYLEFLETALPRIVVNDDACFQSPLLPAGEVTLRVRHPDYKMGQVKLQVKPRSNEKYQLPLIAAPRYGRFYGTVTNFKDDPLAAELRVTDKKGNTQVIKSEDGTYDAQLRPGLYQVSVFSEGYLKKGAAIRIDPVSSTIDHFILREIPTNRLSRLTGDQIEILQVIPFEFSKSRLLKAASFILDDVVDVILSNASLGNILIEGHTDNVGTAEYNLELSQRRADAVRDYLVEAGIPATQLTAKGFGTTKPIATNRSASGRAKNRRVNFVIVGDEAAPNATPENQSP